MTRTYSILASAVVLAAAIYTLSDGTTVELSDAQVERIVDYVQTSKDEPSVAAARLANRLDITDAQALEVLRRAKGRSNRHPLSLYDERIGVVVASADAERVNAAIASAVCQPLTDDGTPEEASACLAANSNSLTHRLCRVTNGTFVALGTRLSTTKSLRRRLLQNVQALDPPLSTAPRVVRSDDGQVNWSAALARTPALRPCEEGE